MKWTAPIACCLWLAWPAPAAAHRVDEYLQASRISVAPDHVGVEIDLTPGVDVAPQVIAFIDVDGDGSLSPVERQSYAALVVSLVDLTVDGSRRPLVLRGSEYPTAAAMRAGTGTIHLGASAVIPVSRSGRHELKYVNLHRPELSVYLINALAPPANVQIASQQRDVWQHELRLGYTVAPPSGRGRRLTGAAALATLAMGILGWFRYDGRLAMPRREGHHGR